MNFLKLVCLFSVLFLIACSDGENDGVSEKICICRDVDYSTEFIIEADSEYCFPDGVILEVSSIDNEFCPCNVVCVSPGTMVIKTVWTLSDGGSLDYTFPSPLGTVLPDGMTLIADADDVVFESECTDSNPSPPITEMVIQVEK